MSQWSHYNPVNIQAGPGSFSRLSELTGSDGRWLLVTSAGFSRRGLAAQVQEALGEERVIVFDEVTPNPELDHLEAASLSLRSHRIGGIIALGGGSAIDAAKVLAVTLVHPAEKPLSASLREGGAQNWEAALPIIAVPTTSGTGSEVTPFATVWDSTANKKHSVAGAALFPRYALLDPELTLTLPADVTLHTGLDALSHALESLWNKNRTAVSEAHAFQALRLANTALPGILREPRNLQLRENMQKASTLAGLAISQTRTAIAHAISYPMTLHYGIPHGLACSFTLSAIIDTYLKDLPACLERDLIAETGKVLAELKLVEKMSAYVGQEDPGRYLDEMFHPDRAGNFTSPLGRDEVENFLRASI